MDVTELVWISRCSLVIEYEIHIHVPDPIEQLLHMHYIHVHINDTHIFLSLIQIVDQDSTCYSLFYYLPHLNMKE